MLEVLRQDYVRTAWSKGLWERIVVLRHAEYMEIAPRLALWPGLCLTIVVHRLNMFGAAVRDLLDPRLRGGAGRLGAGS